MRFAVRHQLSLLLIQSSSIGLATLAIATWIVNHDFVLKVARDGLEAAASLKAVDVAVSLDLMYTSCLYLTASPSVQQALARYNNGSDTSIENWNAAAADMAAALSSVGSLQHAPAMQSQLLARNVSGPAGTASVMNTTGFGNDGITLPWQDDDGNPVILGHGSPGYPSSLYPSLTISKEEGTDVLASYTATYMGKTLGLHSNLVLGPLTINESLSLISMTLPVIENISETNVLGFLTIVQSARLIQVVVDDHRGLRKTGQTHVFGPTDRINQFQAGVSSDVQRVLPSPTASSTFLATAHPAIESAIAIGFHDFGGAETLGSMSRTHNEVGEDISVAYATPPTTMVNWVVVVERTTADVWNPVNHLRVIVLACLFSTLGFFFFASLPLAHWAVRPITLLRAATESTIDPWYNSSDEQIRIKRRRSTGAVYKFGSATQGWSIAVVSADSSAGDRFHNCYNHKKRFGIPTKVDTSKHWVKDDISDLMETFNEMSDELLLQYAKLEDRIQRRTAELDQSEKAAEAANESKTLFVANVSHELKTPLNGILGMCATSIEEEDVQQMRTSLSIIYKSGDLLLRTLNDLLLFSTNQVGNRELTVEDRQFTFQDLAYVMDTTFQNQAAEKSIDLHVQYD